MKEKSVVLLSAGLDSSFNLYRALQDTEVILAVSFDYGQRAAEKEITQAAKLTEAVGVTHKVVELKWFSEFTSTALIRKSQTLPQSEDIEIDSLEKSQASAKAVWVPNRNGIFLNIAAGFAEGLGAKWVIPGFNKEEAQTFPDNSEEFIEALTGSLEYSTQGRVGVKCYSHNLNKSEIVKEALALKLPLSELWPCYQAEDQWCRQCESCKRFLRALEVNGVNI